MGRFWGVTVAITVLSAVASTALAQVQRARVTGGEVRGDVVNGIASFKGIPFAAPPLRENRWQSPQPVVPWSGTKRAHAFAPACMQDTAFAARLGAPTAVSEDCLYLNVWTPAKSAAERLPVMVWVYGGAFVGGATNWPLYDGTHFAEKGVVLVSVAYRVGAFGFLADPELSEESGHGSGDYGLEDQIAALKWVRDNIAQFGGDPHRVTVFGESAGGISVSMLAASPQAKGLYQRAISESGGSLTPPRSGPGQGVPTLKVAEKTGHSFLASLGANDIKSARALPAETILKAERTVRGGFWPTVDGYVIIGDEYELYKAGRFNDTPVLVGTNSDEGAAFTPPKVSRAAYEKQIRTEYGEKADLILAANPHATDAEAHKAAKDNFRDSVFAWSTWRWASLQSEHKGSHKAYLYYFDHRTPASPEGSSHASEIGFVFGNLGRPGMPPSAADASLSELMSSYWVNFAKNGDPNGAELPPWPAFTDAKPSVMHFDAAPSAHLGVPNFKQLSALDQYFAWRRKELRDTSR
ncbi:MAG TPA: carboxylesterase family protein [Steroidobacteraceae bacterium]|nr:carboxylesterase family protein [Steroidobacteraceae bacterium]